MTFYLKPLILSTMADIISAHGMQVFEISTNEVVLKTATYALDILTDKDGASIVYFDLASKRRQGYNIFLFLFNKRRDRLDFIKDGVQPKDYADFIGLQLTYLSNHLRKAGKDILDGSKDWMAQYPWPTIRASDGVTAIL